MDKIHQRFIVTIKINKMEENHHFVIPILKLRCVLFNSSKNIMMKQSQFCSHQCFKKIDTSKLNKYNKILKIEIELLLTQIKLQVKLVKKWE